MVTQNCIINKLLRAQNPGMRIRWCWYFVQCYVEAGHCRRLSLLYFVSQETRELI